MTVKLQYMPLKDHGMPTLLFYDSADAIYHLIETDLSKEMEFMEFASIRIDGDISTEFVRKTESSITYLEAKQSTGKSKLPFKWLSKKIIYL